MNAQRKRTFRLLADTLSLVAPPEPISVSEWADRHRVLSPEASAEPGPWKTERAPYQRVPMEAISDRNVESVVLMWASQLGKTDLQLNTIGYFTGHDPAPIMVIQPDLMVARDFSNDRLTPMYRDSPQLSPLVVKDKSRDSRNTILYKTFPGGRINIAGANSPASLASKPIRVVIGDEIDRFPVSAGKEGDPVSLVTARTKTFYNKKMVWVSTPTIKGASRIEALYEDSTQEELHFPCPSCDELQPLTWRQIDFDYDEETRACTRVDHVCKHCGALYGEHEWKKDYAKRVVWVAGKEHSKTRGFKLSSLAATINYTWKDAVNEFKAAKRGGPALLKTFFNTVMAESWEEEGEKVEHELLLNRREMYMHRVPEGVKFLTAAVDTQDNRFEIDVIGWGKDYSSWRIQYHRVYGDLKLQDVWDDLDEFLSRTWQDAAGRKFRIRRTLMDSGGHFTREVYKWCKPRASRGIYAIKGEDSGDGTHTPLLNGTTDNNVHRATVIRLGVAEGKAKVFSSLTIEPGKPGSCRFPLPNPDNPDPFVYDEEYFKQLTAEQLVTRYKNGIPYTVWVQTRARNEALDLAVYNRAAIEMMNPNFDLPLPEPGSVVSSPVRPQQRKKKRNVSSSL
ncbi:terminase gpA endonuclease subunit [Paenibacillus polymyxa]|uniref:phage terminase large subunit family protein n=1 Tax=Paenibacillus polymyxa TaxID=1406 RepID=UPI002AB5C2BE|nr:terminase gpA endonuclease subunit [Paenibacillus polymyxa]MDY7993395.1 terminase gpA endonuclease subunit [Paenibacillus polymyxa]MDY8120004.1 terminase gpA endonuclease subunit [Paenibacillus polymyxa]